MDSLKQEILVAFKITDKKIKETRNESVQLQSIESINAAAANCTDKI